jgi:hypothetical protein
MEMSSAKGRQLRLPPNRDGQGYSRHVGSRLFGLAAAAALMTLLLTAIASAETKETKPPGYAQVQSATVEQFPGQDTSQSARAAGWDAARGS